MALVQRPFYSPEDINLQNIVWNTCKFYSNANMILNILAIIGGCM
jgi:hypothetical protein